MRVLIVDDDNTSRLVLRRTLKAAGHEISEAANGFDAWNMIQESTYEIVLTDWMMPVLDGLELVRRIREKIKPVPLIVMMTAIGSAEAKVKALESGADRFIAKPYRPDQALAEIENGLNQFQQGRGPATVLSSRRRVSAPPYVGVGIAASTGGPSTVRKVIAGIVPTQSAAFFIVQHGPTWMLESFVDRLQDGVAMKVRLAEHNMPAKQGEIYLAPGDRHMVIDPVDYTITLNVDAPENFVRPAADPLFRSMAAAFGEKCIAVILTGMGRDGTIGAGYIAAGGGLVIAQDPVTSILPSMPQSAVDLGIPNIVKPAEKIGEAISVKIVDLARSFKPVAATSCSAASHRPAEQDAGMIRASASK